MNKPGDQFRNVRATMQGGENWGALLQDALRREPEDVPKGWKTVRDISDEIGKSLSHTHALVARRLHQKKLERRVFMVETINGRIFPIGYYREIK